MEMKIIPIQSSPIVRLSRTLVRRRQNKITSVDKNKESSLVAKVFSEDELYFEMAAEDQEDAEGYSLFYGSSSSSKLLKLYQKILKLKFPYLRTLDIYT
ncbi:MAG: hypothetical protein HQM15_06035 [Deltaproteobacteria bacterium]|nr:hypothetical protein [Deltaproteobacteria bacterium]